MGCAPSEDSDQLGIRWRRKRGSLTTYWAPREDSDQPGHPLKKKAWVLNYPLSRHEDSNQTGRMPRLIWVFAGRTCHFVGFVMRLFRCSERSTITAPRGRINKPIQIHKLQTKEKQNNQLPLPRQGDHSVRKDPPKATRHRTGQSSRKHTYIVLTP